MLGDYYYNQIIRKTVAVFGSLFNNLTVRRQASGRTLSTLKIPLAYGPIQKFLARIDEIDKLEGKAVAIKLPRMSFQIDDIAIDTTQKLNRMNKRHFTMSNGDVTKRRTVNQSVPYTITMSLHVMARTQDDALQVVEQILPTFAPEYTVTVKDFEGPDSRTDVPIILQGITLGDEYEGDLTSSRRLIVYSLTFAVKVRFSGEVSESNIILEVDVDLFDYSGSLTDADSEGHLEEISWFADSEGDLSPSETITDSDDGI